MSDTMPTPDPSDFSIDGDALCYKGERFMTLTLALQLRGATFTKRADGVVEVKLCKTQTA